MLCFRVSFARAYAMCAYRKIIRAWSADWERPTGRRTDRPTNEPTKRPKGLPTYFTLGDVTKPRLVMMHGWPDSPMEFINQFEHYCYGKDGTHYCVAPAIPNFLPGEPEAAAEELTFDAVANNIAANARKEGAGADTCLLYTSPSPRDRG